MPPPAIKTLRDQLFWQYAKIISDSAGYGKKNWGFIMDKYGSLQKGKIRWNQIREYIKEREKKDECIFCGSKENLTLEHLFPRSLNGPNVEKNLVWICKSCNSSKGARRLYEAWTIKSGLKAAKYEVPRIAEGKYLKFLYEVFENNGILDLTINEIRDNICLKCDLGKLCVQEHTEGKLSPLCLDGIATLCLNGQISAMLS